MGSRHKSVKGCFARAGYRGAGTDFAFHSELAWRIEPLSSVAFRLGVKRTRTKWGSHFVDDATSLCTRKILAKFTRNCLARCLDRVFRPDSGELIRLKRNLEPGMATCSEGVGN